MMEYENYLKKNRVKLSIGISIFLIISSFVSTPLLILFPEYPAAIDISLFTWFLGINITVATIGSIIISFALISHWIRNNDFSHSIIEKDIDNTLRCKIQDKLIEEAQLRNKYDKELLTINDLFRIIELSKVKSETTPEKITTNENKNCEKQTVIDKICDKKEEVNVTKIEEIIRLYRTLLPTENINKL